MDTLGNTASPPLEMTELLNLAAGGDKRAEEALLPLIYGELRRIAAHHLRGERPDHTLQSTALVHEAYLRLIGFTDLEWKSRTHFFGVAAAIMRRVLVDYARQRRAEKRGGGQAPLQLEQGLAVSGEQCALIDELDAALQRLERFHPRQAKVVELRFFSGMKEEEIAGLLAVSVRTVRRDWTIARAWIYGELTR